MSTKYGPTYSIDLAPNPDLNATLDKYDLLKKKKAYKSGEAYFQFKRAKFATWNDKATGTLTQKDRGPPSIVDAEGTPMPLDTLIGNGSEVTLKLSLRDSAMGPSLRLETVAVLKLVEFAGAKEVVTDNPDNLPF
jgi:hypothetical protein